LAVLTMVIGAPSIVRQLRSLASRSLISLV